MAFASAGTVAPEATRVGNTIGRARGGQAVYARGMRNVLVALLLLAPPAALAEAPPVPPAQKPAATATFPLPEGATGDTAVKGGGGRIRTYQVARGRDAVATETRAALKKGAWEITKDEPSPSGNAIRITAKKAGKEWVARFTGDAAKTTLILTAPE